MNPWILSISIAYLLGSIPFGYLLVRIFRNEDIREQGSGNIGATNVARSGAKGLGAGDAAAGPGQGVCGGADCAASGRPGNRTTLRWRRRWRPWWGMCFRCGWDSAAARVWPARWGCFLALTWPSAVGILLVFAVVFALTRYVSLASIVGAATFPLFGFYFVAPWTPMVVFGFVFIPLLIIVKHHENIRRLLNGTESRFGVEAKSRERQQGRRRHESDCSDWARARGGRRWRSRWRGGADTRLCCGRIVPELASRYGRRARTCRFCRGTWCRRDVVVTADLPAAVFEADIVLCVTPSEHMRRTVGQIAPLLTRDQIVVSATKGLEEVSLLRMSQVIASLTDNACGVVSGPTFAAEVAAGIPTAIVAASAVPGVALTIQREFSSATLRLYTNDDVAGRGAGRIAEECDCAGRGRGEWAGPGV